MPTQSVLKIRLLGELTLVRGNGPQLILPASKKTRALLGYLIATGQLHRRERLCDLFWDGPSDPRAELRWSLSKIRSLLKEGDAHLISDRQRVGIELKNAAVDLRAVKALLSKGLAAAATETLQEAMQLFSGEFLDGLDLPNCYLFQEWCTGEREAVSRLRLDGLSTLIERLGDKPEEALRYARALTMADPLSEAGHAAVVRLLSRLGRHDEARTQYERARRVLEAELGAPPEEELEEVRGLLERTNARLRTVRFNLPDPDYAATRGSSPTSFTVGRVHELQVIDDLIRRTADRNNAKLVVVTGEAGIGKSHLLSRSAQSVVAAGGAAWGGRAFEPEATHPYAIWLEILRAIAAKQPGGNFHDIDPLLLGTGATDAAINRNRMFDAVLQLLLQVAAERLVAITLDDIQWMDEASSSLLHYIARHLHERSGILLIMAARSGELDDNASALAVLRSLARESRLRALKLRPLGREQTAELVRSADPTLDGAEIFAESEGNPLFTLELARMHGQGEIDPGPTIESVIEGQLSRLSEPARELLLWAAASARTLSPDSLGGVARLSAADMLVALGELERRGLLRANGGEDYEFSHDLIRQTAYRAISQPRRKLMHRTFARALTRIAANDPSRAADLVYHAALAENSEAAAQACAAAGDRALRLFANVDAKNFAVRGLRHVERISDPSTKVQVRMALLKIRILAVAGPGMRPLPQLMGVITDATTAAMDLGLSAAAATGHYLLSVLHQEAGNLRQAEKSTLRAATAGRSADQATRAHQLANTARCLLELETEIDRSRELTREAETIVQAVELELCELHWARGLLYRWDGQFKEASASIQRALQLARRDEDRWREYKCLTWLAMLDYEMQRYEEMQARCSELKSVAARLGEDETPFVATLEVLGLLSTGIMEGRPMLTDALQKLRSVDDKSYLAYALNSAARLHVDAGRLSEALSCASEALQAAIAMRRQSEAAIARILLARAGGAQAKLTLEPEWSTLSARARSNWVATQG